MVNARELEDPLVIGQLTTNPQSVLITGPSVVSSAEQDPQALLSSPRSENRSKKSKADMKDWEVKCEAAIDDRRERRFQMLNKFSKCHKGRFDTLIDFIKDFENE